MFGTRFFQSQVYYLSGSGCTLGDTSITVNDLVDIYGNDVTMTYFGDKGWATQEQGTPNERQISFTAIVDNSDGTWTLTGVKTVFIAYPYTEAAGVDTSHAGGSSIVFSNNPGLYATFGNINNDTTILATWIFTEATRPELTVDLDATTAVQLVTFGQLARTAIAGAVAASTTVPGISMEATQADYDAKTAFRNFSGNPYRLFINPSTNRATKYNDAVLDTGAANAYVIAPSPVILAYAYGQQFSFKALATNTGASTLAVNGLAATPIKKNVSSDLQAGDIVAGQMITVFFDGTTFQLGGAQGTVINNGLKQVPNSIVTISDYLTYTIMPVCQTADQVDNGFIYAAPDIAAGTGGAGYLLMDSTNGDTYVLSDLPGLTTVSRRRFADIGTNAIYIKFQIKMDTVAANEILSFGLCDYANPTQMYGVQTATTVQARFVLANSTGAKLFAVNGNGAANTSTDISSGLTLTNWLTCEMVITSASILFYVGGTLKATHITNIPSTTAAMAIGWGINTDTTAPAIQIAPTVISLPLS